MAPDTSAAAPAAGSAIERCPHCHGAVRPAAPWCTQCWADLRPAPAPRRDDAVEPAAGVPFVAPPAAPVTDEPDGLATDAPDLPVARSRASAEPVVPAWPCTTCGTANPVELDVCGGCGQRFLAALRAEEPPLLALPVVGDVTRLSRGQQVSLALAIATVGVLLVLLLGVLLR